MTLIEHKLKRSSSFLHHPALHTFLLPLVLSLFGVIYASRFTAIQFAPYFVLYVFLLVNKLLETQLTKQASSSDIFLPQLNIFLEILNIGCVAYFLVNGSLLSVILPLCYTLVVHFQYIFLAYDMAPLALVMLSLFKGIGIQAFAFYLQLHFIPTSLFLWSLPMVLPLFLIEANRWERMIAVEDSFFMSHIPSSASFLQDKKQKGTNIVLVLIFLIGIVVLWNQATWLSLFLLVLWPIVRSISSFTLKMQQKKLHLFFVSFNMLYAFIWFIQFPPTS